MNEDNIIMPPGTMTEQQWQLLQALGGEPMPFPIEQISEEAFNTLSVEDRFSMIRETILAVIQGMDALASAANTNAFKSNRQVDQFFALIEMIYEFGKDVSESPNGLDVNIAAGKFTTHIDEVFPKKQDETEAI